MRVSRFAPALPLLILAFAGCAPQGEPVDVKDGDSVFVAEDEQATNVAIDLAEQHLLDRADLFQVAGKLFVKRALVDERGEAHVRIGQEIDGIPVFQAEAILHFGSDGLFSSITDHLARDVRVDTKPSITQREAETLAVLEMGGADLLLDKAQIDMQILRQKDGDFLTYRVKLNMRTVEDDISMPVVFVDAHTGEIVWSYDNLETAKNRKTYDAKNRQTLPGTLKRTEGQGATGDWVLDAAHDNVGIVYDYYSAKHGRDSYNGGGATIISSAHFKRNYVNAYWNGTQMVYGDGDGINSGPLMVLDVVGHEITHAVTEYSSNLVYANESGALNESMSDIFGAAIEAFRDGAVSDNTWKVGEECWTPGTAGDALRYMNNPALAGDFDYWPTRYTGTSDNGGVHWNSGISNLAFYLMVAGGTHPQGKTSVVVPALSSNSNTSIQMAANIFYWANTQCLTSGATFSEAAGCTRDGAAALYGSAAASSVLAAWDAVGVPKPFTWTALDTQSNLSANKNGQHSYSYAVPAGASGMQFVLDGPNGDADLYVRKGSPPTTATYDCRSAGATSQESCTIAPAQPGDVYYVMINAYSAYSGLTFTANSGSK